jgi:GNAT superfamily N-acetyltransferase
VAFLVEAVDASRAGRLRFLRAGRDLYRGEPRFVPELQGDLLRRTDPGRNPFFREAEVDHLVLVEDGRDVGRAAAIRNRRAEEFRRDRTGYFGWFECPNDPAGARALLDGVRARLAARGCDGVLGPVSYSTNDTCGLLVEGFEGPPVLMMPWNPPWYEPLLLGAGLEPAEDLLAWEVLTRDVAADERTDRILERARRRHGWTLRPLRMERFAEELDLIRGIYNRAWEANWGFVPMSEAEFAFAAEDLRRIIDPDLVLLAEKGGEVVAFSLSLPDFNQVLRRLGGSLLPFGWAKALWYARRIDFVRVVAMGVLPGARGQGIEAGLVRETIATVGRKGIRGGECSWTLLRNTAIHRLMESLGARPYRRYRLYRGPIPPVG